MKAEGKCKARPAVVKGLLSYTERKEKTVSCEPAGP